MFRLVTEVILIKKWYLSPLLA